MIKSADELLLAHLVEHGGAIVSSGDCSEMEIADARVRGELLGGDEVLRAVVMALLVAYYRVRPGDTRFEKAALAALPPTHRVMASAQLSQIIDLTKTWARQAETELRRGRDRDASAAGGDGAVAKKEAGERGKLRSGPALRAI
jgi:hypothetical protein